jgi:hypothetical protein
MKHLIEGDHAGVTTGALKKSAVCGPEFNAFLCSHSVEKAVGHAGSESVSASHAILDLQFLVPPGFKKGTVVVNPRSTVVGTFRRKIQYKYLK